MNGWRNELESFILVNWASPSPMSMSCSAFFLYCHPQNKCSFLPNPTYSSLRAAQVSCSLLNSHGKCTFIPQTSLGSLSGRNRGFPFPWSLGCHTQKRTFGKLQCLPEGLSEGERFGSGKGLIISGAQSMSHLEPVHGGQPAGVALLIRAVCFPSFAPPFTEVSFLKGPMSTSRFNMTEKQQDHVPTWLFCHLTLWTIFLINDFEVTCSKNLM